MFKFITKPMKLEDRDTLNFCIGCFALIMFIINGLLFVSPISALMIISVPITILVCYMFYLNNKLGLEQMTKEGKR